MKSWKDLLANFALVIGSCVIFFAAVEGYLRATTELHEFFPPLDFDRESTENYYRYQFLKRYRDTEKLNIANYDADLGWDYEIDSQRIRGDKQYTVEKPKGIVRILMIGDSYTYGNEVGDFENFPHYMEKLFSNSEVLNMGAGGYGVDQMLWKLEKHGLQYQPDIIVAGIFTSNFDRAGLEFMAFSKPVYKFNDAGGTFEVTNRPVPEPDAVLHSLRKQAMRTSYLWTLISSRLRTLDLDLREEMIDSYYPKMERLIRFLVQELKKNADALGAPLVLIHIPSGRRFDESSRGQGMGVMRKYFQKEGIPYLDLEKAFLQRFGRKKIFEAFYFHEPNGALGHFTPEGNFAAAESISRFLCDQRAGWNGDAALLACPPKPGMDLSKTHG